MKTVLKIIGIGIIALIVIAVVFIMTFEPEKLSDYGEFDKLRSQMLGLLQEHNAAERPITKEFATFSLDLAFPFNKLFGCNLLGIPLKAYSNDTLATATISQFEIPAGSDYYRDFTLNIRPRYGVKAPILHIDFMKPAPGTSGLCIMDFFNVDKENIPYETFFGSDIDTIKKALAMVEKYQRVEGRGEITKYLDPFKSPYRFELTEPKAENDAEREAYYHTVAEAIRMILPVYMKKAHSAEVDPTYAARHKEKSKELILGIYQNDFAVNMGKKIFKDSFKKYWRDGFWNVDFELPEKEE